MQTIRATDLARNTRAILNSVASQGETIAVERNRSLVALIVPAERTMTAAQALAGLRPTLTTHQAAAWLKESQSDFDQAVHDPWG